MKLSSVWPGHCSAEITIEFDEEKVFLFSERMFLEIHMPYPFDSSRGKAQFIKDKHCLELTLPRVFPDLNYSS
jgi:hypothetical protein